MIRFLSISVVAIVSFVAGTRYDSIVAAVAPVFGVRASSDTIDLSSVQEVYRQLKANYDGDLDKQALIHGASRGLVEAAGDDYTAYMDPEEAAEFAKSMSGSIGGGIGAEIGLRNNRPTIVRPIENSPAERAGLQPGDVIVQVNDEFVANMTVEAVVSRIRGEIGTTVKLTITRGSQRHEFSITRENITTPAVESRIEGDVGILRISRFSDDTVSAARAAAQDFVNKGIQKVVLDLRDNPGGTVSAAQAVAGLWLDRQVIMTERRGSEIIKTLKSTGSPLLANSKTVVLINEGSASASEIVAGALRDHQKAQLIGKKSYGKGSVQVVLNLDSGAQLKITEARWYTPQGKNIDKTGITPDEEVDLTSDDINANKDPQLERAKAKL